MGLIWCLPDIQAAASLSIILRKLSPNWPITTFSPPHLGPPSFVVYKSGGPTGDTILQCVPEFSYSFIMMFNAEAWAYVSDWKRGSTGWFISNFCISIYLDFLDLAWILDFKCLNLSFRFIYFSSCNLIFKLRHLTM